jgi:hypothetical protein
MGSPAGGPGGRPDDTRFLRFAHVIPARYRMGMVGMTDNTCISCISCLVGATLVDAIRGMVWPVGPPPLVESIRTPWPSKPTRVRPQGSPPDNPKGQQ